MFLLDAVVSFVHIPPETSSILLIIRRVLLTNEDVFLRNEITLIELTKA